LARRRDSRSLSAIIQLAGYGDRVEDRLVCLVVGGG